MLPQPHRLSLRISSFRCFDNGALVRPFHARAVRVVTLPFSRLQETCAAYKFPSRQLPPLQRGLECSTSQAPRRPSWP